MSFLTVLAVLYPLSLLILSTVLYNPLLRITNLDDIYTHRTCFEASLNIFAYSYRCLLILLSDYRSLTSQSNSWLL